MCCPDPANNSSLVSYKDLIVLKLGSVGCASVSAHLRTSLQGGPSLKTLYLCNYKHPTNNSYCMDFQIIAAWLLIKMLRNFGVIVTCCHHEIDRFGLGLSF